MLDGPVESRIEEELRAEYDLGQLRRVPPDKIRRRGNPRKPSDELELTSAFPDFEAAPPARFEWDPVKAKSNYFKHGVTFNEASTVFEDPCAEVFFDPDHSVDEERHLIFGESARGQLLIVSHTDREEATRIISARRATRQERKRFEDGNFQ